MDSVLIACNNINENLKLKKVISKEFTVATIASPDIPVDDIEKIDLLIIDHKFTDHSGIDFLMLILQKTYIPVLMLTPPDDPLCSVEAMRVGAYNYLVKTGDYHLIINHLIREAIDSCNEHEQMKQTIVDLKARINELEKQLSLAGKEPEAPEQKPPLSRGNIIEQISTRLKRGDINLPSMPQIASKFRELIDNGATIKEVADLLSRDVAISSKLLSLSNSAVYGGIRENKTVEQAIGRLGLATTKQYVEVISNRTIYMTSNAKYMEYFNVLWKHSLACAYAAQATAQQINLKSSNEIFLMGLFHDIGKTMLLQIISEMEKNNKFEGEVDLASVQKTVVAHSNKFGASLMKKWKFPEVYFNIVIYNEHLADADPITKELLVINFANLLSKSMGYDENPQEAIDLENAHSTKLLSLNSSVIEDIKGKVSNSMNELTGIVV